MMKAPTRRKVLALLAAPALFPARAGIAAGTQAMTGEILDRAGDYAQLRAIAIWRGGAEVAARGYHGWSPDRPTNIKSASKSVISALVGIAISKGLLTGADQKIAPLLAPEMPPHPDPRLKALTIGNLLSMQSGLAAQSGRRYGDWVASGDWVKTALAAPMVDRPGGKMIYSTSSTHLISAILTRVSGRPTLMLARDWLGPIDGFRIDGWERDPQGIYIGGNEMAMSTRSLMAFGATYAAQGYSGGASIVPEAWIRESWVPRTRSAYTGSPYGYGWFLGEMGGRVVNYGWGFGGQMIYVAPATERHAALAIGMTSDPTLPSGENGYRAALNGLAGELIASL